MQDSTVFIEILASLNFYLKKSWWCLLCRRNIYSV